MGFDLDTVRVSALPDGAFYISDFVTEDEEDWLMQKVCCWCLALVHILFILFSTCTAPGKYLYLSLS